MTKDDMFDERENKRLTQIEKDVLEIVAIDLRTMEAFLDGVDFMSEEDRHTLQSYKINARNGWQQVQNVLRGIEDDDDV